MFFLIFLFNIVGLSFQIVNGSSTFISIMTIFVAILTLNLGFIIPSLKVNLYDKLHLEGVGGGVNRCFLNQFKRIPNTLSNHKISHNFSSL